MGGPDFKVFEEVAFLIGFCSTSEVTEVPGFWLPNDLPAVCGQLMELKRHLFPPRATCNSFNMSVMSRVSVTRESKGGATVAKVISISGPGVINKVEWRT